MHTTRTNDVEMADASPNPKLWCLIEGDTTLFCVDFSDVSISDLKKIIQKKVRLDCPALKLKLWKVRYF